MNLKKLNTSSLKALTLLVLGLFLCTSVVGQDKNKITIKNANSQTYKKIGDNNIFWLVGNIVYEHKGVLMYCDSSVLNRTENNFKAFGNVHINQGDTLHLYGDALDYDGGGQLLNLTGNVVLDDGDMHLQTDRIIYDRNTGLAYYTTGGILRQTEGTLTSVQGYYNTGNKLFTFRDSVRLKHPKYTIEADTLRYGSESKIAYFVGPTYIKSDSSTIYCERGNYQTLADITVLKQNASIVKKAQTIKGDSIYYQMKAGAGEIFGNAFLQDTANKYTITGGYARYRERPEYALVTQNPIYAMQIDDDTLWVGGDTLRINYDSLGSRRLSVFHQAQFYKTDFQGKCDSLIYALKDSVFMLYENPVVWSEENQLTADFIYMTTKNGDLDSMYMLGNAFLIGVEDSNKYNQIKGRNMYGRFLNNELRTIFVNGNGQTVYYAYDDGQKQIGINRADCSNLLIRLNQSKVERVTFITKPNATLYPPGQIPAGELYLRGFNPRFAERFASREAFFSP